MSLKSVGVIVIPDTGREFDHGAFEPTSGRVFVAHTAKDRLEVIDCASSRHLAALPGFHEAAGVVAEDGQVLASPTAAPPNSPGSTTGTHLGDQVEPSRSGSAAEWCGARHPPRFGRCRLCWR